MNNLTSGRAPLRTAQFDKVTDEYFICFFKMHKAVAKLCCIGVASQTDM